MKPIVSVVIPNLNGKVWLDRCLSSMQAQTLQPTEIMVVDNGSTDGSVHWIHENYPSVRVLEQTHNLGFAAATNLGIQGSSGEFVAFLNNDAWAEPDWLARCTQAMGSDPAIASAASRTLDYHDPSRIYSLGDGFLPNGDAFNIGRGMRDQPGLPMPRLIFGPSGCTAVYRRAALEAVGLLDEDFFAFHEDVDLNLRLQLADYKCLYVPEAVAYHVGYATARKANDRFAFISGRNRWFVLLKNWPWSLWLRFAPRLAYYQARLLWWAVKGNRDSWMRCRGSLSALAFLPRELRKRRRIQQRRRLRTSEIAAMLQAHQQLWRQLRAIANQEEKAE